MLYQPSQANYYKHSQSTKHQQGVVIVVALFVVALVATMAYVMMSRLERDTRRTTLILRSIQAEQYAQGSIGWAIEQLRNDWLKQKADKVIDVMPIQSPVNEVDGYRIVSTIYDMQSRFNVNNLTDPLAQQAFHRLLRLADPALTDTQANLIVRAATDWVTPMVQPNEYSEHYAGLLVPYRPAHRAMVNVSELRLVKGMTPALYRLIEPYLVALPTPTAINVQTAPAPVLAMLGRTINMQTAERIVQARKQNPFIKPANFLTLEIIKSHPLDYKNIKTVSQYFLVKTEVSIENQHRVIYTLLERAVKNNEAAITIVGRF